MNHETNSRGTERTNYRTPNHALRRMVAIGLVGVVGAVGGAAKIASANSYPDTPHKPDVKSATQYGGYVDPSIKKVYIDKGGKIRSDSSVPDLHNGDTENLLGKTTEKIEVPGNDDIVVDSHTVDGTFYGIPAESLERVDPDLKLNGDEDGYVWVSDQKGDAKYSNSAKSDPNL
ncbi:MAG: hypothetical protein NTV39_01800 [Candidatus Saccharibacteria bacterium]|nr:hypothetical protein [Candidatus Saccharibacteria bacterium]